jgi:hypothetical protein
MHIWRRFTATKIGMKRHHKHTTQSHTKRGTSLMRPLRYVKEMLEFKFRKKSSSYVIWRKLWRLRLTLSTEILFSDFGWQYALTK